MTFPAVQVPLKIIQKGYIMLTSKQRSKLKAMASRIDAVIQIGKEGITDNLIRSVSQALEARELVKVSVLNNCEFTAKEICGEFAEKLFAEPVQAIGNKIVLYRRSQRKNFKHIELD